jgi:hypothetical protein
MADDEQLRALARSIVLAAEHDVDVERDLADLRERPAGAHAVRSKPRPKRRLMLAVAAITLLLFAAVIVGLSRRGEPDRVVTAPDPVPTSSPPSRSTAPTTEPLSRSTAPTTEPGPLVVDEPSFAFAPPVEGRATVGYDTSLQSTEFSAEALLPFDGEATGFGRSAPDRFWVADTTTGEVVVFDVEGTVSGARRIPAILDGGALRSIAVGPDNIAYGLFVSESGDNVTVAAYELTGNGQPIRTWTLDGAGCAEYCFVLDPTADGMTWEGELVPYIGADGQEVQGSAVAINPVFTTTWASANGDAIPDMVDISGPNPTDTSEPDTTWAWTLRVEQIVFNSDLNRMFVEQVDGSFTTRVQLEAEPNASELRHDVLLWMAEDLGVAPIDFGSVPGLIDVAVGDDGALIGLVRAAGGISIGRLVPSTP